MAKSQNTCDRCGQPAVAEATFKTTVTTELKFDLCQAHLAELKSIMRAFSKQDAGDIVVTDNEVKVKK